MSFTQEQLQLLNKACNNFNEFVKNFEEFEEFIQQKKNPKQPEKKPEKKPEKQIEKSEESEESKESDSPNEYELTRYDKDSGKFIRNPKYYGKPKQPEKKNIKRVKALKWDDSSSYEYSDSSYSYSNYSE